MRMKKIFTLIATALMTLGVNAQTWNFSDFEVKEYDDVTVVNGLTINAASDKKITIDENSKTVEGVTYTKRLKLGGSGSATSRNIAFTASGAGTLKLISTSSSSGTDRELGVSLDGTEVGTTPASGSGVEVGTVSISGAGTVTIYSKSSGVNLYLVEFTTGGGGGGATGPEETYSALSETNGLGAAYAAVVGEDGKTATNVANGNSIVTFSTANVSVQAVGSGVPADKVDPDDPTTNIGQDITIGAVIDADAHTYELVSINTTKPITWEVKNQGDINFYYIAGQGNPSISRFAKQNSKDGNWVPNAYTVVDVPFNPVTGGEPQSGLYYKFTTAVDGALKVGIWANKGNRTTFLVDGETKQCSPYLVEGYINGQNYTEDDVTAGRCTADQVGKKKYLNNDEIKAIHDAKTNPWSDVEKYSDADRAQWDWVIGAGDQNFWGNVIIDTKAGKTYWLFQGNSQIGFQGYTFVPGAKKEDITKIESIQTKTNKVWNPNAPMYNLSGQKVDKSYKGIVIQNGRKFLAR